MNRKIFRASFFTAFLVLVAAIVFIMGILFDVFENQIQLEAATEAEYLARAVENEGVRFFDGFNSRNRRITLIDADGQVLFDNQTNAESLENHAEREEIKQAVETGKGMSIRYSKTLTEKTLYYAVKLSDNTILRISTNQYTVVAILLGILQPILVILVAALILTAVLSSRVSKAIIKPINELDLEHPEKNETYEELAPLLRKISKQKNTINQQMEALKKKDDMRREFTANVSHELKTPLTSISGFAELMKSGDVPNETVTDFSKSIYDEAQRLISLVNDIIKLSELDEKSISLESETVDLYKLSEEMIDRLKSEAAKKNVTLHLIGANAEIVGIRKILDEMIYNLCDNAIKYNRENGSVDIVLNATEYRVYLTVRDTGIGIPEEHQSRVFERFYRVDKSHSKKVGGTGLGLAIVKHGALYHNADINLESIEGKGTSITVCFNKV